MPGPDARHPTIDVVLAKRNELAACHAEARFAEARGGTKTEAR